MLPSKTIKCHRTGFTRTCREIVCEEECRLWMQLQGIHPQTGEELNKWGCADELLPLLLIENSQQQRQTGAAIESFRNEVVQANKISHQIEVAKMKMIPRNEHE